MEKRNTHVESSSADKQESFDSQTDAMARLLNEVEVVLKDGIKRQQIESWHFLKEVSSMFDFHFQWALGKSVLLLLFVHRRTALQSDAPAKLVRAAVLVHLDEIFHWAHDEVQLREDMGDEVCDAMLSIIHEYMLKEHIVVEDGRVRSLGDKRIIYENDIAESGVAKEEKRKLLNRVNDPSLYDYIFTVGLLLAINFLIYFFW